ncbi:hypothetical protein ACFWU5_27135 [Nocardia sp. NPDC058640]|uniref:hypothetical protein n=1 Tax=Nocardia sp. NPDC058640 TaxID=3346571 RepID=UPI00365A86B7
MPRSQSDPTPPHRTTGSGARLNRAEIPSTIWATGTQPLDASDSWPEPIIKRAVLEFTRPGDRIRLVQPATTRRQLSVVPSSTDRPNAAIAKLKRKPDHQGTVDLLLASMLPHHHDPAGAATQLAALAADELAEGGVLVVLTRCTHTSDGTLIDPTGPVVAAGQNADLLYLGHIVAVPITDDTITGPPRCVRKQSTSAPRHRNVHVDVLVFLQPRTTA